MGKFKITPSAPQISSKISYLSSCSTEFIRIIKPNLTHSPSVQIIIKLFLLFSSHSLFPTLKCSNKPLSNVTTTNQPGLKSLVRARETNISILPHSTKTISSLMAAVEMMKAQDATKSKSSTSKPQNGSLLSLKALNL